MLMSTVQHTHLDDFNVHDLSLGEGRSGNNNFDTPDNSPFSSSCSSPVLGATHNLPSGLATPITRPSTPAPAPDVAENFAFAFDIDGVLIRGGKVLPEAVEAMRVLNGDNDYGVKVPHIFLTNGGGKFEAERCQDLTRQLQTEVQPGQFICGHTPMRELAARHTGTVLVVGGEGDKCRRVAEAYGFQDVITPADIIRANAATTPFRTLSAQDRATTRDLLQDGRRKIGDVVVDAVLVFADSRDWAADVQIILDVALSQGGRLETRSESYDKGPPIYFSHNDLLWSAAHQHARLGLGALRCTVEKLFAEVTGGKGRIESHAFGKPQLGTFEFADRLLQRWRAETHGFDAGAGNQVDTVYFVGDTPESDICGANTMDATADSEWYSILVKTGVYRDGTVPAYQPRETVPTVLDAVKYGIAREVAKQKSAQWSVPLEEVTEMTARAM